MIFLLPWGADKEESAPHRELVTSPLAKNSTEVPSVREIKNEKAKKQERTFGPCLEKD